MNINWLGVIDNSGYGIANKGYISAFQRAGMKIKFTNMDKENPKGSSWFWNKNDSFVIPNITMHHYVPNEPLHRTEGLQVGYNTWETDKLPQHWVENINKHFDLQLVPSEFNKRVYENSGVTIPIRVLPHIVQENNEEGNFAAIADKTEYKFLSVFQWTARKNPIGLLKTYFSTFYKRTDVLLVLKTYRSNHSVEENNIIFNEIKELINDLGFQMEEMPKVAFIFRELSETEMKQLCKSCDCFVLPHRGEGFGLPIAEAIAANLPVITTSFGGHNDFCQYEMLIDYFLTPVCGMPWIPHYSGLQNWAEPNLRQLSHQMKSYVKYKKAAYSPQLAKREMFDKCSEQNVVNKFKEIMKEFV